MWQVDAGVIGLAFVVLVLIVETVRRSLGTEQLWRNFYQSSRLLPITLTLIAIIIVIGGDTLALSPSVARSLNLAHSENLAFLDFLLFVGSLLAVLVLYLDAFMALDPTWARGLASKALKQAIALGLDLQMAKRVSERLLREECERAQIVFDTSSFGWASTSGIRSLDEGFVVDIHLDRLAAAAERLEKSDPVPRGVVAAGMGARLKGDHMLLFRVRRSDDAKKFQSSMRG
jgi:hypothetical protein